MKYEDEAERKVKLEEEMVMMVTVATVMVAEGEVLGGGACGDGGGERIRVE